MTNTQHTPGPWVAMEHARLGDNCHAIAISANGLLVGEAYGPSLNASNDFEAIAQANANLIARAPALKAENEKLKQALRDIISGVADTPEPLHEAGLGYAIMVARKALGEIV